MNINETIDFLTYRSWWYQINWYGMDKIRARKLYPDWEKYEKIFEEENHASNV